MYPVEVWERHYWKDYAGQSGKEGRKDAKRTRVSYRPCRLTVQGWRQLACVEPTQNDHCGRRRSLSRHRRGALEAVEVKGVGGAAAQVLVAAHPHQCIRLLKEHILEADHYALQQEAKQKTATSMPMACGRSRDAHPSMLS